MERVARPCDTKHAGIRRRSRWVRDRVLRPSYRVYFETALAIAASGPPLAPTYPISVFMADPPSPPFQIGIRHRKPEPTSTAASTVTEISLSPSICPTVGPTIWLLGWLDEAIADGQRSASACNRPPSARVGRERKSGRSTLGSECLANRIVPQPLSKRSVHLPDQHQILVTYHAQPGSSSEECLRLLATLSS